MTRLLSTSFLLLALSSCMYLLPEGRALRHAQEEHARVMEEYQRRQQALADRKSDVNRLRRELAAKQRSAQAASSKRRSSSPAVAPNDAAEINALQQELRQKEAELRTLNQQINSIH